ncbi:MAG: hypothetical protein ACTHJQ_24885 [Rhizobiaceae bacterium]
MRDDIPYAGEVVARTISAIDHLLDTHPDKAQQAIEKPVLQGWFAGKIMKQFGGYGDYADIVHMVGKRLALRALESRHED